MPGTPFESRALKNICLTIRDGEFIGVIGHTGSGKSTLITHLNGLLRPEPGAVFVNGVDLGAKETKLTEVRRTVGLVFQYPEYQLFEETVAKDISFGPKNLGLGEAEIEKRVREAAEKVGLAGEYLEKSPFELSGGQKRRVAIAGVLAMQPQILVLDEPAAGLDPAGREEMLRLMQAIHADGTTVVMVSHSMDDVGRLCDRLIVLSRGEIAFDAPPAEVFTHAAELEAIGLSVPECARLAARLRAAGFEIPETAYRMDEVEACILRALKGGAAC